MALALAPAVDASLGAVFEEAGQRLEVAKSADKDCIWLLGRTLEWKQFAEAADLKDSLMRMIGEFRRLSAIFERSVRDLSRNAIENVAPAGSQIGRGTALALSSAHPPDPGRGPRRRAGSAAIFRRRAPR